MWTWTWTWTRGEWSITWSYQQACDCSWTWNWTWVWPADSPSAPIARVCAAAASAREPADRPDERLDCRSSRRHHLRRQPADVDRERRREPRDEVPGHHEHPVGDRLGRRRAGTPLNLSRTAGELERITQQNRVAAASTAAAFDTATQTLEQTQTGTDDGAVHSVASTQVIGTLQTATSDAVAPRHMR